MLVDVLLKWMLVIIWLLGECIKKTEETDELRIFNGFCSYLGRTCGIYVTEENAEGILTAVFRQKASGFPLRK